MLLGAVFLGGGKDCLFICIALLIWCVEIPQCGECDYLGCFYTELELHWSPVRYIWCLATFILDISVNNYEHTILN